MLLVPRYMNSRKHNAIDRNKVISRDRKQKVDGVSHRRQRELQVVRAEEQACKHTVKKLCDEMAENQKALDAAISGYERRKAELVERQIKAHEKLALILQSRSAAEMCREKIEDQVENELKAKRTACTVRAYRLDARWRQLYNHYRGFVVNVLGDGDSTSTATGNPNQCQPSNVERRPATKFGRRFFAVADRFGAQYRRESLRTSQSLQTLMSGYLRETFAGNANARHGDGSVRGTFRQPCPTATTVLDTAEPERVLEKLRVMQEQCARIAERVRRRTGCPIAPLAGDVHVDGERSQSDLLEAARHRVAAVREYMRNIRELTDRAVADVRRDRTELRKMLWRTYTVCVGRISQPDNNSSYTVAEIAGRLERACFDLFTRLDRACDTVGGTNDCGRDDNQNRSTRLDAVTLCLRAVQTHRSNAVRRAHEVAYRVKDFHKAVTRLLLATAATSVTTKHKVANTVSHPRKDNSRTRSRVQFRCNKSRSTMATNNKVSPLTSSESRLPDGKVSDFGMSLLPAVTVAATVESVTNVVALSEASMDVPSTSNATVTMTTNPVTILCPPSIGIIEYE